MFSEFVAKVLRGPRGEKALDIFEVLLWYCQKDQRQEGQGKVVSWPPPCQTVSNSRASFIQHISLNQTFCSKN